MEANTVALTPEEVRTLRAAMRAGRVLAGLLLAVAVPLVLQALAAPLGVALLTIFFLSPLLVTAVLLLAARRTRLEQRRAQA